MVILVGAVICVHAGTLNWGNTTEAYRPAAEGGGVIPYQDPNCTLYLYQVGNPVPLITGTMNASDGYWYHATITPGGFDVYAYLVYSAGPGYYWEGPVAYIPPMGVIDWKDYIHTGPESADWQVIPEPGTFALMTIGLFGLAARRWKSRKA